jgi:hypothetical protein
LAAATTPAGDTGYSRALVKDNGRLLMLNSDRVASGLYQWRRHYANFVHAEGHLAEPLLPAITGAFEVPLLPAIMSEWMERASLLHGVPFNYLVPNERLLPAESLRFFMLDPQRLACLLDGAFSVDFTTLFGLRYNW